MYVIPIWSHNTSCSDHPITYSMYSYSINQSTISIRSISTSCWNIRLYSYRENQQESLYSHNPWRNSWHPCNGGGYSSHSSDQGHSISRDQICHTSLDWIGIYMKSMKNHCPKTCVESYTTLMRADSSPSRMIPSVPRCSRIT